MRQSQSVQKSKTAWAQLRMIPFQDDHPIFNSFFKYNYRMLKIYRENCNNPYQEYKTIDRTKNMQSAFKTGSFNKRYLNLNLFGEDKLITITIIKSFRSYLRLGTHMRFSVARFFRRINKSVITNTEFQESTILRINAPTSIEQLLQQRATVSRQF